MNFADLSSYASEDRGVAEEIQLALAGAGHDVFFDKASLPAGGDYHSRIERAVKRSDMFVFLISPNSVAQGSYALTELRFARSKWQHPKERLLPVRLHGTAWEAIPAYLKSVTVLEPEGNIAAEVAAAVAGMTPNTAPHTSSAEATDAQSIADNDPARDGQDRGGANRRRWVVSIATIGVLGGAAIAYWLIASKEPPVPDAECREITVFDYAKVPPESRIVKRCEP